LRWHTLFLIVNTLFLIVAEMLHMFLRSSMIVAAQDVFELPVFYDESVVFPSQPQQLALEAGHIDAPPQREAA
jgi:hypothetical protein